MQLVLKLSPPLALALLAGVTWAFAQAERDPASEAGAAKERGAVGKLSPELPDLVSAFRRPQEPADRIPGDPVRALEELGDAQPGENPALARRLTLPEGRHTYVWPERDGVCYSLPGGSGCAPTDVLRREGVLVGTSGRYSAPDDRSPEVWVFALTRDGVDEIHLTFRNGTTSTHAVRDNGVLVPASVPVEEARWRNPDGSAGVQRNLSG